VYNKNMKNKLTYAGIAAMGFLVAAAPALAASVVALGNAGVGQKVGDATSFGVAICNNGTQAVAGTVPFTISANGRVVNAMVAAPLAAGACKYTYFTYGSFGMTAASSYSVNIAIDPNQTVTTNVDAPATYMLTVPGSVGQVLGASTTSDDQRSQLLAQLASMVAILEGLLARLMGK
jgi:hypothetical protein